VAAQARQRDAAGPLAAAGARLGAQLPTAPPPPNVAARLRRALAAGWADQVQHIEHCDCHTCMVASVLVLSARDVHAAQAHASYIVSE